MTALIYFECEKNKNNEAIRFHGMDSSTKQVIEPKALIQFV